MRQISKAKFLVMLALALAACSPAGSDQNPRDRKGSEGALTWRVVSQADGQAAFLSRPGAAPDVVLWCRDGQRLVLRAHIFENPVPSPDLRLTTKTGSVTLTEVRRQGGVRAGDRKLVEGAALLSDAKVQAALMAASDFTLQSGNETYQVQNGDPSGVLPSFMARCAQAGANPPLQTK